MVPFVLQSSTTSAVLRPCPYQNWVMLPSKTHSKSCKKINKKNNAIVAIISQHLILNLSALVLFVQRMFFWGDYFSAKCSVKISLSSRSFSLFLSSFCFFPCFQSAPPCSFSQMYLIEFVDVRCVSILAFKTPCFLATNIWVSAFYICTNYCPLRYLNSLE